MKSCQEVAFLWNYNLGHCSKYSDYLSQLPYGHCEFP